MIPIRDTIPARNPPMLYPQPVRRQPAVEYLPERRRAENPPGPPER